jgi:hypothetical protein
VAGDVLLLLLGGGAPLAQMKSHASRSSSESRHESRGASVSRITVCFSTSRNIDHSGAVRSTSRP